MFLLSIPWYTGHLRTKFCPKEIGLNFEVTLVFGPLAFFSQPDEDPCVLSLDPSFTLSTSQPLNSRRRHNALPEGQHV